MMSDGQMANVRGEAMNPFELVGAILKKAFNVPTWMLRDILWNGGRGMVRTFGIAADSVFDRRNNGIINFLEMHGYFR